MYYSTSASRRCWSRPVCCHARKVRHPQAATVNLSNCFHTIKFILLSPCCSIWAVSLKVLPSIRRFTRTTRRLQRGDRQRWWRSASFWQNASSDSFAPQHRPRASGGIALWHRRHLEPVQKYSRSTLAADRLRHQSAATPRLGRQRQCHGRRAQLHNHRCVYQGRGAGGSVLSDFA